MKVGFLSVHTVSSLSREEKAAWEWLQRSPVMSTFLSFHQVNDNPSFLDPCQVLWWHSTEIINGDTGWPSDVNVRALKDFCRKGGGLLLSLLAASYVQDLGLESTPPDRILTGKWEEHSGMEGYPDMRGFHGFLNHPLFKGLYGGIYTWMPARGETFCEAVYSRDVNPRKGDVVALERGRISMNDDRKCMTEYRIKKGTVLTIGTHLYFAPSIDEFRRHREALLSNVFSYLADPPPPGPCFFPKRPIHDFSE